MHCISASSWSPSEESSLFSMKPLFSPFSSTLHPDGFHILAFPALPNLDAFTERLVAPSPTGLSSSDGLSSTNKSATPLLLSLCPFLRLFFTSNSLADLGETFFSSFTIRLQWVPGYSFLPGNEAADELAGQVALLPCNLSPLNFRIHSSLFSDWRRIVSSKFFNPHHSLGVH